jgi:cytochrome c oxidase assembly factor CtaG
MFNKLTSPRATCYLSGQWVINADAMLSAPMVEHLFLMLVVAPFVLYGWPLVPMLRGLLAIVRRSIAVPSPIHRRSIADPLLRLSSLRSLGRWLVTPVVAWMAMNTVLLGRHVPAAYDFALRHEASQLPGHFHSLLVVHSATLARCRAQGQLGHPHLFDLGRCG